MAIHDVNHRNLENPLQPQRELNVLPWPFLIALFAVLAATILWVVAN